MGEPHVVELLNGKAMGEHVNNLGNADTGAFYSQFTACPFKTGLKVFTRVLCFAFCPETV